MSGKVWRYVIGLFICSLGVSLVISADVGAMPWDAVYVGFSEKIGLTVGSWTFIFQLLFILLAATFERKKPDLRIFVSAFINALFIDFLLLFLLKPIPFSSFDPLIKWSVFVLGLLLLAVGIRVYVASGFPKTPEDELMFAVASRFTISFSLAILFIDGSGLISAFFVGGPVGFGSIISPILLGIFLRISLKPELLET